MTACKRCKYNIILAILLVTVFVYEDLSSMFLHSLVDLHCLLVWQFGVFFYLRERLPQTGGINLPLRWMNFFPV